MDKDSMPMYEVPGWRLNELGDAERERDALRTRLAEVEAAGERLAELVRTALIHAGNNPNAPAAYALAVWNNLLADPNSGERHG